MKKIFFVLSVLMATTVSNAYEYRCQLTNSEGAPLKEFVFDVATEANKFVNVDKDLQVGCLQFSSQKPLLSCLIGNGATHQTVTTDLGVSLVGLDRAENGRKINLTCLKYN